MLGFNNEFYKKLFYSLDNNSVLMKVEKDGTYYPVWCSKEFTDMMEGTSEDFIRLESGGTMKTIHPDDRDVISYLFRHHVTRDGKNSVTVRKLTMSGKWIWVCINYAFISDGDDVYAYCTYFDVSELKESQNQAEAMIFETEKQLGELGDKVTADEKAKINSAKEALQEALKGDDTDDIKAKTEALTQAFYPVSSRIYQEAQAQQQAAGAAGAGAAEIRAPGEREQCKGHEVAPPVPGRHEGDEGHEPGVLLRAPVRRECEGAERGPEEAELPLQRSPALGGDDPHLGDPDHARHLPLE